MPTIARLVLVLAVTLLSVPARSLHAQRERLVLRLDAFGDADRTLPAGAVARDRYAQQSLQLSLAHRLVTQQGSTIVLLGGQWRGVRAALPRERTRLVGGDTLDAFTRLDVVTADLMLLKTIGTRHTLVAVARPGLYGESFRVEGAAFVDRLVSTRTTVGAGLSYASSFGKLLPIPVVHVVSRASRRVLVDALLPSRADVWWMPRKGLDLGVNVSLAGAQYALPAAQQIAGARTLWLANATAGPQVRWAPQGGKWQFTADAGYTVLRRLEYAKGGTSVADLAPGNVPYGRVGVQRLF
jgi:hypothetical protein